MKPQFRAPLFFFCLATLALSLGACGDDDATPDAGPPDAGPPDAGPGERTTFPGLDGTVEVVRDTRGMVHIYATTTHDVMFVEGYRMALDRFPQMELMRRNVTGRLSEVLPADPQYLQLDLEARWSGHARNAEAIYATLGADSEEKLALDAFSAGVSLYIEDLLAERVRLPLGAEIINFVISSGTLDAWRPQDTLAIARYMVHSLGYAADEEIQLTAAREAAAAEFPAGDPREDIFSDLWSFKAAEAVYTRTGIPNFGVDTGTRALRPPGGPVARLPEFHANRATLARATRFFAGANRLTHLMALSDRGSNNWVVSGSKTATGNSLLMNDPHLSLNNPPLFWYVQLNTKRDGGPTATLNTSGLALVGSPVVLLGYNDSIAWGLTVAYHDATDVYEETITDGGTGPDTVLFNGAQVPIETVDETINVSGSAPVVAHFERVPHHGFIVPEIVDGVVLPRTGTTALSVRWTGDTPSNEAGAIFRINQATSIDEARTALQGFETGAQNFVFIERGTDDIFWSTQARLPVRPDACLTYDPATRIGIGPMFVMPGDGTCEWGATAMSDRYIPHDFSPARGFIATANQDPVGVTDDGNPLNDGTVAEPFYAGWEYDLGHREARITSELTRLTTRGNVTVEEMRAIQNDERSPMGTLLVPALVTSLEHAAAQAAAPGASGPYPELDDEITAAGAATMARVELLRERLAAWDYTTPAGVEGTPTAAVIAASVATTIFNTALTRIVRGAFFDETERLGERPSGPMISKALERALLNPSAAFPAGLATYDAAIGDTILWDDVTTVGTIETRDEIILRAFVDVLDAMETRFASSDMDTWRWGKLHVLQLSSGGSVPAVGRDRFTLPLVSSTTFPDGYPRHGDLWGVDASNYDVWTSTDDYSYHSGPQQRLVVEMTDTGPKIWNALAGSQVLDTRSPHFGDEIELWRNNEAPPLFFTDADVTANTETTTNYTPQ
jgi:penicillin amidase